MAEYQNIILHMMYVELVNTLDPLEIIPPDL